MVGFGNSFAVTELALSQRQLAMTAKKSAPFDTYEYIKEVAASLHQTDKTGLKIVSDHADGILDSMVLPSGVMSTLDIMPRDPYPCATESD